MGNYPASVASGDLNGDNQPDLAIANSESSSVSVLINRGGGRFRARVDYATGVGGPGSVAIGDLNGDDTPEIVTANYGGNRISVLANNGGGSFGAELDYRTGRRPLSVAIGDLNGDRKPDLATANNDASSVSVLLNTPGLCTVQNVKGQRLPTAKRTIARANCRVGRVRRTYTKTVKHGRVISQNPRFGAVLPGGAKVNLVVSRGRRPRR